MGCFLGCFGSSKDAKRRKQKPEGQPRSQLQSTLSTQINLSPVEEDNAKPTNLVPKIGDCDDKPEEQSSCAVRKKVTFDSSVKVYDRVSLDEPNDSPRESKENASKPEEFPFTSKVESHKKYQNCRDSDDGDEGLDYYDSIDDVHDLEDNNSSTNPNKTQPFALNNRYQNCRDSDDEEGILDYSDSDLDDDDDGEEFGDANDDAVGANFGSVLTPIENLTQWRSAKAKPLKPLKENSNFGMESKKTSSQEVSVDASLSNWLVSSESTSVKLKGAISVQSSPSICGGSNLSLEDRPILGVLTVEDLRQCSATSTPRRSPSPSPEEMPIIGSVGAYWKSSASAKSPRRSPRRNPDDMAIIGSVGSYWSDSASTKSASSFKGIPNTTSKYREDKKVNWHTTPFETRLERALNNKSADEASCVS